MVHKFCTQCGSALNTGKRFCTQCGKPIIEPPATVELASKIPAGMLCTQCGATILKGKKFCTQCGEAAVANTAPPLEPAAAILEEVVGMPSPHLEAASPAVRELTLSATESSHLSQPVAVAERPEPSSPAVPEMTCAQCGFPVISGKRFCTQCGQQVTQAASPLGLDDALTEKTVPTPPPSAESVPVFVSEPELTLNEPGSVVEAPAPAAMVEIPQPPPQEAVDAGTSASALFHKLAAAPETPAIEVERTAPPQEEPALAETAIPVIVPDPVAPTEPPPIPTPEVDDSLSAHLPDTKTPEQKSSWRMPVLVSVAVLCILGAAAGGIWWHTSHAKKTTTPVPGLTSASNGAAVTGAPKPSAAIVETEPQPLPEPAKIVVNKPRVDSGNETRADVAVPRVRQDSTLRQPPPPSPEPVPVQPTSGTLHYSGPPVRYGESIAFANLPHDRLRFTFDHQSWQPLISHQPDGTQKLTLISIRHGEEQTHCDVGWEIVK